MASLGELNLIMKSLDEFCERYEKHEVSVAFSKWSAHACKYFNAVGLTATEANEPRRLALLEYMGGERVEALMPNPAVATAAELLGVWARAPCFMPPVQSMYHAYKFGSLKRRMDQTFASYAAELRKLAAIASIPAANIDSEIISDKLWLNRAQKLYAYYA